MNQPHRLQPRHFWSRLGVPLTYMPIFVRVVFGILGDVEGFPLPLKRTKSLPLRQIIIARFFMTIIVTRYFSPSDHFPTNKINKGTSFVTHGNVFVCLFSDRLYTLFFLFYVLSTELPCAITRFTYLIINNAYRHVSLFSQLWTSTN